jgi:hypothetical protein
VKKASNEMKAEYDFSAGVRGAVANVRLDLAGALPDSKSVNDALRALVAIAARIENRKRA